jgi:transglutaminase superfamily protein
MWAQLQRFRKLDAPAQKIFLRAWLTLPLVALSLRLRGFGATQRSLQRRKPSNPAENSTENSGSNTQVRKDSNAELTARMVAAAARRSMFQAGCLERSLTLWWLLEQQGLACQIRIGTRKSESQLEAHAWVEYNGLALNEEHDLHTHYAAFEEAFRGTARAKK